MLNLGGVKPKLVQRTNVAKLWVKLSLVSYLRIMFKICHDYRGNVAELPYL